MTPIVLKPFKAAINFMMNKGCFEKSMSDSELADILDLYYQLCSLEVTVKSRAENLYLSFQYVFELKSKVPLMNFYTVVFVPPKGILQSLYSSEFSIPKILF